MPKKVQSCIKKNNTLETLAANLAEANYSETINSAKDIIMESQLETQNL